VTAAWSGCLGGDGAGAREDAGWAGGAATGRGDAWAEVVDGTEAAEALDAVVVEGAGAGDGGAAPLPFTAWLGLAASLVLAAPLSVGE